MNFNYFHEFISLSSFGSYSATAKALNMSVSSLSQHVSALERNLDVKLVERSGASIALTDAGEHFAERIQDILSEYESIRSECRSMCENMLSLKLLDNCRLTRISYYLPSAINAITADLPSLSCRVKYIPSNNLTLEEALARRVAHVGVLFTAPGSRSRMDRLHDAGFTVRPWYTEPLSLFARKDSALAATRITSAANLDGLTLLVSNAPSLLSFKQAVIETLSMRGVQVVERIVDWNMLGDQLYLPQGAMTFVPESSLRLQGAEWDYSSTLVEKSIASLGLELDVSLVYREDDCDELRLQIIDDLVQSAQSMPEPDHFPHCLRES